MVMTTLEIKLGSDIDLVKFIMLNIWLYLPYFYMCFPTETIESKDNSRIPLMMLYCSQHCDHMEQLVILKNTKIP